MASAILALSVCLSIVGCTNDAGLRKALAEANPLSSGFYHIQIVGENDTVLFAYKSQVCDTNGKTRWDGIATIGAYNLAFEQTCVSVYSSEIQAKKWRSNWVYSNATSPRIQLQEWLELIKSDGRVLSRMHRADKILPLASDNSYRVVGVKIKDAPIEWSALCDAHIDSMFGTQAFLTDVKTCDITLYFHSESYTLIGAIFTAKHNGTTLSGTITLSAYDGHELEPFPGKDSLTEGTLYEEWDILVD